MTVSGDGPCCDCTLFQVMDLAVTVSGDGPCPDCTLAVSGDGP